MKIPLFGFRGRLGRMEYITVNLLVVLFVGIVSSITMPFLIRTLGPDAIVGMLLYYVLLCAFVLSVSISTSVRRLHDLDKSGAWILLKFVPLVNVYLFILLVFVPGTPCENQYSVEEPDDHVPLSGERFNFTSYEGKR